MHSHSCFLPIITFISLRRDGSPWIPATKVILKGLSKDCPRRLQYCLVNSTNCILNSYCIQGTFLSWRGTENESRGKFRGHQLNKFYKLYSKFLLYFSFRISAKLETEPWRKNLPCWKKQLHQWWNRRRSSDFVKKIAGRRRRNSTERKKLGGHYLYRSNNPYLYCTI